MKKTLKCFFLLLGISTLSGCNDNDISQTQLTNNELAVFGQNSIEIELSVYGGNRFRGIPVRISEEKTLNPGNGYHDEIWHLNFQVLNAEIKNSKNEIVYKGSIKKYVTVNDVGRLEFRYAGLKDDDYTVTFSGQANKMIMSTALATFRFSASESIFREHMILVSHNDEDSLSEMLSIKQQSPDDIDRELNYYDWTSENYCNMHLISAHLNHYKYNINCLSQEVYFESSNLKSHSQQELNGSMNSSNITDLVGSSVTVGSLHGVNLPKGNSDVTLELVPPDKTTSFYFWFSNLKVGKVLNFGKEIYIVD